MFYFKPQS